MVKQKATDAKWLGMGVVAEQRKHTLGMYTLATRRLISWIEWHKLFGSNTFTRVYIPFLFLFLGWGGGGKCGPHFMSQLCVRMYLEIRI